LRNLIWLSRLDSIQVTEVSLMRFANREDFNSHVKDKGLNQQLIEATVRNVGKSKVRFTTNDIPDPELVYLVSGSRSFVQAWSEQVPNLMLVLWDEHFQTNK
jgi:hypothetical protein